MPLRSANRDVNVPFISFGLKSVCSVSIYMPSLRSSRDEQFRFLRKFYSKTDDAPKEPLVGSVVYITLVILLARFVLKRKLKAFFSSGVDLTANVSDASSLL